MDSGSPSNTMKLDNLDVEIVPTSKLYISGMDRVTIFSAEICGIPNDCAYPASHRRLATWSAVDWDIPTLTPAL